MKTSNVKKILSIVILSLILAITITTIVLAVVPKKLYNPITDNYKAIIVYKDKVSNIYHTADTAAEDDKVIVAKIKEKLEMSVKDNILSSMFQGVGSFEERVIYEKTSTDCMSKVAKVSGSVCLIFDYLKEQTLELKGNVYTHPEGKGKNNSIVYTKIFMPLNNTEDFQKCTVYLAGSDNKSNFQVEFLAHQSELYDYIVNLQWDIV